MLLVHSASRAAMCLSTKLSSGAGSRIGSCRASLRGWCSLSWELCWLCLRVARLTALFGVLWGVGGLTFGLSMRYLGVALGQSIALGTCAGLGTILTPLLLGRPGDLTASVVIGVVVTLLGIAVIGVAGHMKSQSLSEEEKRAAVKDFNFTKGIAVALLAGFMSACFNIGLGFGEVLNFGDATADIYKTLPATFMVTLGGFMTNAIYCLYQNAHNKTFADYGKSSLWANNLLFCALAGVLWYSQFFGLSLGKGFLTDSPSLLTFSWCILMALNVVFSNVWGVERLFAQDDCSVAGWNNNFNNKFVPAGDS